MSDPNPFDHTEIDDVIHGRLRLGIMAYLSSSSPSIFGELKAKVATSDGNLSTHLKKLEEANYVRIEKRFVRNRPQTRIHLTAKGRKAWISWLAQMRALMEAAE
ncbi:MAG: transcriptional regulator [Pseudomonadota bacterium]